MTDRLFDYLLRKAAGRAAEGRPRAMWDYLTEAAIVLDAPLNEILVAAYELGNQGLITVSYDVAGVAAGGTRIAIPCAIISTNA